MTDFSPLFGIPITTDPALPPGVIELRHPDGTTTRHDLDPERRHHAHHTLILTTATWWGLGWAILDDTTYLFQPPPPITWDVLDAYPPTTFQLPPRPNWWRTTTS